MVKKIYQSGNAIGVHSYTHDYKKIYVSPKAYTDELLQTEEEIYKILGVRPIISRAPGGTEGHFTKDFWTAINNIGYIEVGWNALTGDADGRARQPIKKWKTLSSSCNCGPISIAIWSSSCTMPMATVRPSTPCRTSSIS